jgi:Na+/phosphate symporter
MYPKKLLLYLIKNLAGLLILEQTATKITARYLLDIKEVSLDTLIRRMDNITRSLIIDTMDSIRGKKNYTSIKQRDADVNRLNFLIIRTVSAALNSPKLRKKLEKEIPELCSYKFIAGRIEKIADRQKRISRCSEQLKISESFTEEILKVYKKIKESYTDTMKSYYNGDKKIAADIELTNKKRNEMCNKLLSKDIENEYTMLKKSKDNKEILTHVHEHMIITEMITNIKAVTRSVKMIARNILNCSATDKKNKKTN